LDIYIYIVYFVIDFFIFFITRINKIYRDALNDLKYQTEEEINLLRAYTDGVNSYIDRLNIGSELLSLPAEFIMLQVKNIEPWR